MTVEVQVSIVNKKKRKYLQLLIPFAYLDKVFERNKTDEKRKETYEIVQKHLETEREKRFGEKEPKALPNEAPKSEAPTEIKILKYKIRCKKCGYETSFYSSEHETPTWVCPSCGSKDFEILEKKEIG